MSTTLHDPRTPAPPTDQSAWKVTRASFPRDTQSNLKGAVKKGGSGSFLAVVLVDELKIAVLMVEEFVEVVDTAVVVVRSCGGK